MMKRAVFLDRDGVINESPGDGKYVLNSNELKILPGVPEAIRLLNEAGYLVAVISNQRGVARGLMSPDDLQAITHQMISEIGSAGASLAGVFYCTHDKNQCDCRKPLPGLFHQAEAKLDIDLDRSFFVGDTRTDIEAGHAAGCKVFLVLTGKTTQEMIPALHPQPDYVAANLYDVAQTIISLESQKH
jgi:D-glycero-D-manno-heptose 1,7-bisphosphate phosphatase